ncbi:MAG TPA: hypothetical protein VKN76_17350 [Kiloniellaceae bacterium]|nr:hypothetical protein [Kiloniellaceae bacterium]
MGLGTDKESQPYDRAQEVKSTLKVTWRSLALVLLGAVLLQLPFGTAWLSLPAAVVAVFVLIYAFAGLILTAIFCRSLLWNAVKPRDTPLARAAFSLVTLLPVFAVAVGLYGAVGAVLAP